MGDTVDIVIGIGSVGDSVFGDVGVEVGDTVETTTGILVGDRVTSFVGDEVFKTGAFVGSSITSTGSKV